MCDLEVDGYGQELDDRMVRAAKAHKCNECGRRIEVGETHGVYVGLWEGDFFQMRTCSRCTKARKWLEARGHGWQAGDIREWVRICVDTDGPEIIQKARVKRLARGER